jgi:hypothetical protein
MITKYFFIYLTIQQWVILTKSQQAGPPMLVVVIAGG